MERTHMTSTLAVFLSALCILSSRCCTPASAMTMKEVNFTYYLHDNFVPPDVTAVAVAGANASIMGPSHLGDTIAFDSVLRETASSASAQIGHFSGLSVSLSNPQEKFILFVLNITLHGYSGTISGSARFNITAPTWEEAVSSGTGSFRGVAGHLIVSAVSFRNGISVLKYDANLILPDHSH
ncbi:hypothetical protein MPTK1_6g08065 [Marchantia polymorpha subsp. ruderalis]|nr:hypothetical protein MARPO_0060s0115 [Marchantia polymorpha]BBN13998.1 hypothetical protein Mp_6g08060 [Marchantia polymorpha subsp. ruderalis]BBN20748.1 hypothetical protein Mp_zg00930 [Marchantia polymorpha subsp. ruderalis]|eukprot:PTQ37047.1 hypothetical protein MARPO_0060s0115 [Marchantia polymorpha]